MGEDTEEETAIEFLLLWVVYGFDLSLSLSMFSFLIS
jgi:hypothetical protein